MDKRQLRNKYKIKRQYFQHSAREVADGAICDAVCALAERYQTFFVYNSFGSEADTRRLIARLLSADKRVFLPRTEGKEMVAVPYAGKQTPLTVNAAGIGEPSGQVYFGPVDVAVVPLLAVNGSGYRLGYGGGYYDRFFKDRDCLKVGIGYYFQLTEEFVQDEWDVPLDLYICERGIMRFGKSTYVCPEEK